VVEVNSLGNLAARNAFKKDLLAYFSKYQKQLDEDSKRRLEKNPLRILDSKNPALQELIAGAPALANYINAADAQHFAEFIAKLEQLKISYRINPRLVRGLDYYNRTVYEWVTDKLGAQSAIGAGGRYDGLTEQLGGPSTPAVGFAMGVERVLLLLQAINAQVASKLDGYFICVGEQARQQLLSLAEQIRTACPWFSLAINYDGGSFKSQFKKADKSGARLALIVGEEEISNTTITVKFLREQWAQETILMRNIATFLGGYCGRLSN